LPVTEYARWTTKAPPWVVTVPLLVTFIVRATGAPAAADVGALTVTMSSGLTTVVGTAAGTPLAAAPNGWTDADTDPDGATAGLLTAELID
jgi:hypothetical protein